MIGKTLKSAVANAEHNHELDANTLIVNDKRMTKIFEVAKAEKKGFTLSRASEKNGEAPAP